MHQVEIFRSSSSDELQEQINSFLSENADREIKDIKFNSAHNTHAMIYTAMIIYL